MFQEILPNHYNVEYHHIEPTPGSLILCFNDSDVLVRITEEFLEFPKREDYPEVCEFEYLFKIDDTKYFLYTGSDLLTEADGYCYESTGIFRRKLKSKAVTFAGITAFHIYKWYKANRFCGACCCEMSHSTKERMLYCKECGNTVYPKISPVVIVGVIDGDRLLMTKYNGRAYRGYSLIAGFIEVGETPEDAAIREVMEETGVNIKNLRYYRSQPWGYSDSLLMGFFAELDGDDTITMDEEELSVACWVQRQDIDMRPDDFSLTNEMICSFKDRNI